VSTPAHCPAEWCAAAAEIRSVEAHSAAAAGVDVAALAPTADAATDLLEQLAVQLGFRRSEGRPAAGERLEGGPERFQAGAIGLVAGRSRSLTRRVPSRQADDDHHPTAAYGTCARANRPGAAGAARPQ
jgi:hypothetical protein